MTPDELHAERRAAQQISHDLLWNDYPKALLRGDHDRAEQIERAAREWDHYADLCGAQSWEPKVLRPVLDDDDRAELQRLFEREVEKAHAPPRPIRPPHDRNAYGRTVLYDEWSIVTNAEPGIQTVTLYRSACRVGRCVGAGLINYDDAFERLLAAAVACGLGERRARSNIKRGLAWGVAHPKAAS